MTDLLPQLPEFDPHPNLWTRIEADLDSDLLLTQAVYQLPDYEPNVDLWTAIDEQLTQPAPIHITPANQPVIRPLWSRPLWASLTAAALVVLVGTWLVLRSTTTETIRMEYAVEQLPDAPTATDNGTLATAEHRAEEFIAQQCAEQELACQRPEVHELRDQLADLTTEQKRIERERLTFGDDPALVQAQVKIENQRAEVTKELITLLRS